MPAQKRRKQATGKKQATTVRRRRAKANPDEYRRKGLVTVDHDSFSAMLFAPEKLKLIQDTTPGILMQNRSDVVQERYVVQVRRIDRTWEYLVAIGGEEFKIPGKVFDRLMAYRKSIIEEQRRDRTEDQLRRVAAADQAEAAREPYDPAVSKAFLGSPDLDFVGMDDDDLA